MAELDTDFAADDEISPFLADASADYNPARPDTDNDGSDEDSDLNASKPTATPRFAELDDSGDELEHEAKAKQQKYQRHFDSLFADSQNITKEDCVVQEEGTHSLSLSQCPRAKL